MPEKGIPNIMPRTAGERNPSDSVNHNLFQKSATILSITAIALSGCTPSSVKAREPETRQQQNQELNSTANTAQSSEIIRETGASTKEYKMSPERTHYQEILDAWYAQDIQTIKEKASAHSDKYDPVGVAEFTAALYQKYAVRNDVNNIILNNHIDISDANYSKTYESDREKYSQTPIFGANPLEMSNDQLNGMLGSLEIIAALEAREAASSSDSYIERADKVIFTLKGDSPTQFDSNLGWSGVSKRVAFLRRDEEPTRLETTTKRITKDNVKTLGVLDRFEEINTSYEEIWVLVTPTDKGNQIAEVKRLLKVDLKEGVNKVPDFDGLRDGFEYAVEGTPASSGHAVDEFSIAITQKGEVFDLAKLNLDGIK